MKKNLLALSLALLPLSFTFAGPLVSGGMPETIICSSKNIKLHIMVLGKNGGGTLIETKKNASQTIELACETKNTAVPQLVNTKLLYVCGNQEDKSFVNVYREIDGIKKWALVMGETANGVSTSFSLKCDE